MTHSSNEKDAFSLQAIKDGLYMADVASVFNPQSPSMSVRVVAFGVWRTLVEFVKTQNSPSPRRSHSDGAVQPSRPPDCLTREEVSLHTERHDCWVIIKDRVYDVSTFGEVHPGGDVIYTQGGRDATDVFASFHAASTWSLLKRHYLGDLVPADRSQPDALLEDFRNLRRELKEEGLFRSDKLYYLWKIIVNFSILASVVGLLTKCNHQWNVLIMAAFLLALFLQQMGWLAHDFCHHQVFLDRFWNNVGGYFFGNICQGFSTDWWKNKHNKHHAATNEIDHDALAVDPDIDTLPLLAWSDEMLKNLTSSSERLLIRYQHFFFIPVLLLARYSWAQQSFFHSFKNFRIGLNYLEFPLILMHYFWMFVLAFCSLTLVKGIIFLLLAQAIAGFFLALAFVQSHNGMEVYGDVKDFVTAQVISTRDIAHSPFVDFFMGGLNYQIEHHLFPTMPRHNLRRAQTAVKALCDKHGLPYEECSMTVGTQRVVGRLLDVAKLA